MDLLFGFCCGNISPPSALLNFNPLKENLNVTIDLDNTICDPLNDICALIPYNLPTPTNLSEFHNFICLKLETSRFCESLANAYLPSTQQVPKNIYCLCYFKDEFRTVKCIGKSKPFPYEQTNKEQSIWVQRNTPFKLPTPRLKKTPPYKNESVLSRSTQSESNSSSSFGSFLLGQRSPTPNLFNEEEPIADEKSLKGLKINSSFSKKYEIDTMKSQKHKENISNINKNSKFILNNSCTSMKLFSIDESAAFYEDSQPSPVKFIRSESLHSENAVTSRETDLIQDCIYYA